MIQGVFKKQYSCEFTVFPSGDVRGRQTITREFVDDLVALNIGFSIHSEEIPTGSFTATSTWYHIRLSYKNSTHLMQFSVQGGNSSGQYNIQAILYRAGSTTTSLKNTTSISSTGGSGEHTFCALLLYSANWFAFTGRRTPDLYPTTTYQDIMWGAVLERFDDLTKEEILINLTTSSTSVALVDVLDAGYLSANDVGYSRRAPYTDADLALSVEKLQRTALVNTNWLYKELFAFSNLVGATPGSIITMNNARYIVLKIRVVPEECVIAYLGPAT